jgi:hypothetical protein
MCSRQVEAQARGSFHRTILRFDVKAERKAVMVRVYLYAVNA